MKKKYLQFINLFLLLLICALTFFYGKIYGERIYWLFTIFFLTISLLNYLYVFLCVLALKVETAMSSDTVVRGQKAYLHIRLTRKFPIFIPRITLYVSLPEAPKKPYIYKTACANNEPITINIPVNSAVKGVYSAGIVAYTVSDLFGFAALSPLFKDDTYMRSINVLPKTIDNNYDLSAGDCHSEKDSATIINNAVFAGEVREYVNGDPLKKVHWKLSARLNKLFVKEYEDEAKPMLDMFVCTKTDGDSLFDQYVCELVLSIAAYCIKNQIGLRIYAGASFLDEYKSLENLSALALHMSKVHFTSACGGCARGTRKNKIVIADEEGLQCVEYARNSLYFYMMPLQNGQVIETKSVERNMFVLPLTEQFEHALKGA